MRIEMDRNRREDGAPEPFGGLGIAYEFGRATGVSVGWWRPFG